MNLFLKSNFNGSSKNEDISAIPQRILLNLIAFFHCEKWVHFIFRSPVRSMLFSRRNLHSKTAVVSKIKNKCSRMVAALLGPGKENFKPLVVPPQQASRRMRSWSSARVFKKDDSARRWSSWRGRQGGKISTSDKESNDEILTFN